MVTQGFRKIVKALITVLIAYVILAVVATGILFNSVFGRTELKIQDLQLSYSDIDPALYPRSEFFFDSGGNMLQGYLYGEGNEGGLILIAHGIRNGADGFLPETMYFVDNGWRVFSFDGTGSRNSEGKGVMGLPQTKLDVIAAIEYIRADLELKELPLCLFGHSMGGYAVTAALEDIDGVAAVVSLSGFESPMGVMYDLAGKEAGFLAVMVQPFIRLYQWARFGEDADSSAVKAINSSNVPVLLIFGTEDDIIDPNTVGLYAFRHEITTPQFSYIAIDRPYRNNHTDMLRTDKAGEYAFQKREELAALNDLYGGDIPVDEFSRFYESVDLRAMLQLDPDIMEQINSFFLSALK